MTSPNLGDGSLDDFADAANAIGLAAMQAMQAEDHIQAQIAAVAGPLGGIVEFITDGLGSIIADIQAYVTTGDTANLTAAAEFVQSKIAGLLGDVVRLLDAVWEAMSGEYEGDDEILQGIQALFAPLRKLIELITGVIGGLTAAPAAVVSWLSNLQEYLQGNEIGSDPAGFFTGLGNVAQTLADALFGGLTGAGAVSGKSVAEVQAAAATVDNRITALENGSKTLYTCGSSTTLDLSTHAELRVYLWTGATQSSGAYFAFRSFSAAHLTSLGVNLSAVSVVVGSGVTSGVRNPSRFGNYGSSWALENDTASSFSIDADGIFRDVTASTGGADGATTQATGRRVNNGGAFIDEGTTGTAGGHSHISAGGAGGTYSTGAAGGPGGAGGTSDFTPGAFAGGGGGGSGAGGGASASTGYNGGAGGSGGWPGGGAGIGGLGGRAQIAGSDISVGSTGPWGTPGQGGVVIVGI